MPKSKMHSWQPDFSQTNVLFGGAFDPPHLAHLQVARACQKTLPKAKIYFLPAYQSVGKLKSKRTISFRQKLLELSLQEIQALEKDTFFLWDYELKQKKMLYTIDTLKKAHSLGARKEKLFFLMGSEQYEKLAQWKKGEELRHYCQILIAPRSTSQVQKSNPLDRVLEMDYSKLSSSSIRLSLKKSIIPKNSLAAVVEVYLQKLFSTPEIENPYS